MSGNDLLAQYKAERASELENRLDLISKIPEDELQKAFTLQMKAFSESLEKKYRGMNVFQIEASFHNSNFDFAAVKTFLEKLPDIVEKLKFLIELKAEFERSSKNDLFGRKKYLRLDVLHFGEDCQIEIDKFEKLLDLEERRKEATEGIKKNRDLTLDRAALALNYLLTSAKANCHNTEKAKFISFLTGYSEKQIAQKLSKLHKKEDENHIAYQRDMKVISQYFAKLGLNEITNQIENDLNI